MRILVKSHKRKSRNGVSVVRQHTKNKKRKNAIAENIGGGTPKIGLSIGRQVQKKGSVLNPLGPASKFLGEKENLNQKINRRGKWAKTLGKMMIKPMAVEVR
jgi:hypothetical protein